LSPADPEAVRSLPSRCLPRDVRLWWIDLDGWSEAEAERLHDVPEPIRARAGRMVRPEDARRLLATHHAARWLLARALDRRPEELAFSPDLRGKPQLRDGSLQFNLSHSGPWALLGVSRSRAIGVDVEELRAVPEAEALARDHFTAAERDAWEASGPEARDRAFLRVWTRKEACAKALGAGLLVPPRGLDVGASPGPRRVTVPAGEPVARPGRLLVVSPVLSGPAVIAVAVGLRRASGSPAERGSS
jgi:4'-phosphopantetheinyl transferase